ncbi:hypothetical protein LSH36_76g05033 [Paralvinella palmiformis]|uniref:Cyclic nucleotide-binding domain-containing protein n=1 Tax=Paralvinella palmiformis TaxID=53620 RepID=A0AAD9K2M3_9ANNE|nr:hypothetical protein LSH36_76g05033 [Paralvinella palmiformis]
MELDTNRSSSPGSSSSRRRRLPADDDYQIRMNGLKRTLHRMARSPVESLRKAGHRETGMMRRRAAGRPPAGKLPRLTSNTSKGLGTSTKRSKSPSMGAKDDTLPSFGSSRDDVEQLSEVSINSLQTSGRRTRNMKLAKKARQGFLRTFAKLGKFVCILIGLWKKHANRVREFLDNVDLVSVDEITDLLFDKTDYSADKRARISFDTKRILSMPHHLRTDNDIRYVEIALRNYPSIAAYPVSIQNLIARKAWYELYSGKRIIIKQGHVARCFYFILSGKVIISQQEDDSLTSRTLCYLNKGDSFGELALINNSYRTATVISEGTVELLVVTDEDYEEIFTSGGLTEKYFPFLKGISCFQEWPTELLINNFNKASITYSKRKTVICENTSTTPWIYVIKSGSVTVLKKLKEPNETTEHKVESRRRLELQKLSPEDHYRRLCTIIQKEGKLNRKEALIRHHKLKELRLGITLTNVVSSDTNSAHRMDAIDESLGTIERPLHSYRKITARCPCSNREIVRILKSHPVWQRQQQPHHGCVAALRWAKDFRSVYIGHLQQFLISLLSSSEESKKTKKLKKMMMPLISPLRLKLALRRNRGREQGIIAVLSNLEEQQTRPGVARERTTWVKSWLLRRVTLGHYDTLMQKSHGNCTEIARFAYNLSATSARLCPGLPPRAPDSDLRSQSESPQFNPSRRVSFDLPQVTERETKEDHKCFVTVQTLVKGDVFGLAELIHGKQPTFILVSNGAECIMIDKRLYWEKATDSQKLMRKLKDEVLSYPTDEKMQSDLMVAISWERYKQETFHDALSKTRLEKKLNQLPPIGLSVN